MFDLSRDQVLALAIGSAAVLFVRLNYIRLRQRTSFMPNIFQFIHQASFLGLLQLLPRWLLPYQGGEFSIRFRWRELYKNRQSDIISFTSLDKVTVLVADPALTKQITSSRQHYPKLTDLYTMLDIYGANLLTTEGPVWKRHRQVTSPSFSESLLRLVHQQTLHHFQNMTQYWTQVVAKEQNRSIEREGIEVRMDHEIVKLALYVISGAGFGTTLQWDDHSQLPAGHRLSFHDALDGVSRFAGLRVLLPDWMFRLLPSKEMNKVPQYFHEFEIYMNELVKQARDNIAKGIAASGKSADLLTSLVAANIPKEQGAEPQLSDSEMYGNAFIYLLAGHETTAHTLIFALINLCLYPDIQEKLYREIRELCGDNPPAYEDYSNLIYTQCVFNETLRLFPPAPVVPKVAAEDMELGGYQVKAGTEIHLHIAALHTNEAYWGQDAYEFRPERFDARNSGKKSQAGSSGSDDVGDEDTKSGKITYPKNAFIPFSDGVRSCIGKRFAQIEGICILASLIQKYQVSLAPDVNRDKILESRVLITTTPIHPVKLIVKRRASNSIL